MHLPIETNNFVYIFCCWLLFTFHVQKWSRSCAFIFILFSLLSNKLREQKWNRLNCVSVSCNTRLISGFVYLFCSPENLISSRKFLQFHCVCAISHMRRKKTIEKEKRQNQNRQRVAKKKMEKYIFQSDSIHVIRQNIDILQTTNS